MAGKLGVDVAADLAAGQVWLKLAGCTGTSCTVIAGQVRVLQTLIDSYKMPSAVQTVSFLFQSTPSEQPLGLIDYHFRTSMEHIQKQSHESHHFKKPGKYNPLG